MKFLKLLIPAHVAGLLRHPHEGALPVNDDEAGRLLGEQSAEDVSADFAALDADVVPLASSDAAEEPAADDTGEAPQPAEAAHPASDGTPIEE